jgi:hypothetical protein
VKAEHCLRLDVRQLARRKLLRACSFGWHWSNSHTGEETGSISIASTPGMLRLTYSVDGSPMSQAVTIERTPCALGGSRPWFRCPLCARRVAVLFMRGGRFACRHCGSIAYRSQSEDAIGRGWLRQCKLESRLGENWRRPKGMRRATHQRILERIFDCEEQRDDAIAMYVSRMTGGL